MPEEVFEDVSQPGGTTVEPTSVTEAPAESAAPTFEVDGKTLTADEAQERLHTSDEAYRRVQGERDRAIHQAGTGQQAVEAWQWVYENRPDLYEQLVGARDGGGTQAAPAAPAPTTAAPSGQPPESPEQLQPLMERLRYLEGVAQTQEQRHWDAWADGEKARAQERYQTVTGKPMPQAWERNLYAERQRTRTTDLVNLTEALLFQDIQAGRVTLNRDAIVQTQANATRGATQPVDGSAPVPLDVGAMSDEEVYLRGKAGLGLPQADTRWVGDK